MDYFNQQNQNGNNNPQQNPNNYNQRPTISYLNYNPPIISEAKKDYETQKKKLRKLVVIFLVIALIINVAIGVIFATEYKGAIDTLRADLTKEITAAIGKETHLPEDYVSAALFVVEKNLGSTVEITATTNNTGSRGTGFIINNNGDIVTNAHVVRNSENGILPTNHTRITINFYKQQNNPYEMSVRYFDDRLDIAVLSFKAQKPSKITPVTLINSDYIKMGEDVIVIGNAQGYGLSLTRGVLSAEPHELEGVEVLRTDAPINPGNSGGPMFNALGECMAISSFKIIESQANEGLSYGITSNELMNFLTKKKVQYVVAA